MSTVIQQIINQYQNFDPNNDGDPAIKSLSFIDFEVNEPEIPNRGRLVIVLVESRILQALNGAPDLTDALQRFKGDLRAEGLFSCFINADLYDGARHQDGRTLLALREFIKDVHGSQFRLEGVILVGSFPEATLVRRTIWSPNFNVIINGTAYQNTRYLAIEPELIAARAEIVLADLNGGWENVYFEDNENVESMRAMVCYPVGATQWPVNNAIFNSDEFDQTTITYRDFFFIDDGDYTVLPSPANRLSLFIRHRQLSPELAQADRNLPNPISRPDIMVSRINARHIAINPANNIQGDDGTRPMDAQGIPQTFVSTNNYNMGVTRFFDRDQVLERELLQYYFDLNHRHRTGAFSNLPFRAGAIGAQGASPNRTLPAQINYISDASNDFESPVVASNATLLDYVKWFKEPATIRAILAHSGPTTSEYHGNYAVADLESELGGNPFRWKKTGNQYEPSLDDQSFHANLYIHRTAWQNRVLGDTGANLMIHGGCQANTSQNTQQFKHYDEEYASFQNVEGILFYMNGVALLSRAKVFNDSPTGFPGSLRQSTRSSFGNGWKAYFDNDSSDASLGNFGSAIKAKKTYFWSVIGDWTVRLRYQGGIGILGFDSGVKSLAVHANEAWIDGWNFDGRVNGIRLTGDLDSDGQSEFVVTSEWGIGILKHAYHRWEQVIVKPKDTWFGGWRYNASVNTGKDVHHGVGKFTGRNQGEILVTSSWGIGILGKHRDSLYSYVIHSNGTRLGHWLFDSRANRIQLIGNFDGDDRDEIFITSQWGVGVLKVTRNRLHSITLSPNGTRLGHWVINTDDNKFHTTADLDGNGKDSIILTSPWGIGALEFDGNELKSKTLHANGSNLNGYVVNTYKIRSIASGKFSSKRNDQLVILDDKGLHLIQYFNGSLQRVAFWQDGDRIGGWLFDERCNEFHHLGDIDGDSKDELFVRSPWGIGIIGVSGNVFTCKSLHAFGSKVGDWVLKSTDRFKFAKNLKRGSGKSQILVQCK